MMKKSLASLLAAASVSQAQVETANPVVVNRERVEIDVTVTNPSEREEYKLAYFPVINGIINQLSFSSGRERIDIAKEIIPFLVDDEQNGITTWSVDERSATYSVVPRDTDVIWRNSRAETDNPLMKIRTPVPVSLLETNGDDIYRPFSSTAIKSSRWDPSRYDATIFRADSDIRQFLPLHRLYAYPIANNAVVPVTGAREEKLLSGFYYIVVRPDEIIKHNSDFESVTFNDMTKETTFTFQSTPGEDYTIKWLTRENNQVPTLVGRANSTSTSVTIPFGGEFFPYTLERGVLDIPYPQIKIKSFDIPDFEYDGKRIEFNSVFGAKYRVYASNDLEQFSQIQYPVESNGLTSSVLDFEAYDQPRRFYRIEYFLEGWKD